MACLMGCAVALIGCGDDRGAAADAGRPAAGDARGPDGASSACTLARCSNGIDDDDDGLIDGADPECVSPGDPSEERFWSGHYADNIDPAWQDCFFDGNSGSGDDGCRVHTCCSLGASGGEDCPMDGSFDPARDCFEQAEQCTSFCQRLTPAGCDCFGCCTVCEPGSSDCTDVLVNPDVAPDCVADAAGDETRCPPCIKHEECAAPPCDLASCVLCRGQSADDLPEACGGVNECPGSTACASGAPCEDCSPDGYCSTGCCVAAVQ